MADETQRCLDCVYSRNLLGLSDAVSPGRPGVVARLETLIENAEDVNNCSREIVSIGNAALYAFLQANVTGPPLEWDVKAVVPLDALLPTLPGPEDGIRSQLITWLSVDGEAVYPTLPYAELFVYAKIILNAPELREVTDIPRARLRVNTWHQRLLNHPSPALEQIIYTDLEIIEKTFLSQKSEHNKGYAVFLLERASVHLLHGFDARARADLEQAALVRSFEFVITGRLGKRTKFQQNDISQLVVIARSAGQQTKGKEFERVHSNGTLESPASYIRDKSQPQALRLEDDTLLESISFNKPKQLLGDEHEDDSLPHSLASLDPGDQPLLDPLDAIILLATASSITNTSPADGMTREETLPYAERVISGGSSNWQVFTQALLVRSRIEGYRTRTMERGVLQLQAVVDQVIAETTRPESVFHAKPDGQPASTSTFLPRPNQSESAPATERLLYIHQLATPPRWQLESELANRWASLGALRTALEIYERLQLWAEAALCLAAEGKERKARKIIRRQLFRLVNSDSVAITTDGDEKDDLEEYTIEREPIPPDAPRLFCILGDLEALPSAYERAWEISNQRFARAQRSLGKYYVGMEETAKADEAYTKSLKVNPQSHATWFALGCVRLQTEDWPGAVDAFGRAVQIEDTDAESWSNLAVSLLRLPEERADSQKNAKGAFIAMKRATALKRDNSKLWQNLLAIAIRLSPPPYPEIVMAQTRLIELLGTSQGEAAVDVPVVEALLAHVVEIDGIASENPSETSPAMGLRKLVIDLITKQITPLVTSSRSLWLLIAKVNIHLKQPLAALNTYEKAWRGTLNQPGWESSKGQWKDVLDSTIELIDAYESLGGRERESGLGAGEMVAKDWRFKARSAAMSVLARAKDGWEEDEGYNILRERLEDLKAK